MGAGQRPLLCVVIQFRSNLFYQKFLNLNSAALRAVLPPRGSAPPHGGRAKQKNFHSLKEKKLSRAIKKFRKFFCFAILLTRNAEPLPPLPRLRRGKLAGKNSFPQTPFLFARLLECGTKTNEVRLIRACAPPFPCARKNSPLNQTQPHVALIPYICYSLY